MYERKQKGWGGNRNENDSQEDKLSSCSGSNATAKAIAAVAGVNEKTVRRAVEFAKKEFYGAGGYYW